MTQVMLVGNPNSGKTSLFNALTGDRQRVGNWPGVTVEKKTGLFTIFHEEIKITDLPGLYSLVSSNESSSQDAQIASRAVITQEADILINVLDACHLERHLYLTTQLLELGQPLIVVLNMIDLAVLKGITIDPQALSKQLNCPVVVMQAHRSIGIAELQQAILSLSDRKSSYEKGSDENRLFPLALPASVQEVLSTLESFLLLHDYPSHLVQYIACRVLEGDTILMKEEDKSFLERFRTMKDLDVLMADARYHRVHEVVTLVQKKRSDASEYFTAKLDRIVLHRFWALPIFFAMMYVMFLFAINIGGAFQDFFDISTNAIFVEGSAWLLNELHMPKWLVALFANGVGKGINTTLTFIPVIASMFFFLSLLETSGYMARAAFVVDKVMQKLGLPGKAFVPMIVGFGCNVPAIMAARTLDSSQDKLLTVLMSPFMSCSARLTIYAVFVTAFFPHGGQNIVFSLYLVGILMAILTGFLLRKTMLQGKASPLILELPSYHRPTLHRLMKETSLRLRYFIWRAGKVIVPVCVVLGGMNALTIHGSVSMGEIGHESVLSLIGQWLTPIFSPMGIYGDNWPATVGLLSGMLAKEVVVGSLSTLYAQLGNTIEPSTIVHFDFIGALQTALWSIPHNLAGLGDALMNPILASARKSLVSQSTYGVMYQHFDGKIGAYAYLLFILLYIPCVSTMAAIKQEASRRLMCFSITWSLIVAYVVAVLFYQLMTMMRHPEQTILCVLSAVFFTLLLGIVFRLLNKGAGGQNAAATH